MKMKKSVIILVILALISVVSIGTYFFVQNNEEVYTYAESNIQIENNMKMSASYISEEYVTKRIEEKEVLVSEKYILSWEYLNMQAITTTADIEIFRPIITAKKEVNKETALPGEKIEYTITVRNSGNINGIVVVKDTEPDGTTFVEESIKIDGEPADLTKQDLIDGIELSVPAKGKMKVSFEVMVKKDTNLSLIKNTAQVNNEPTNEVITEIQRPILEITKDSKVNDCIQGQNWNEAEVRK